MSNLTNLILNLIVAVGCVTVPVLSWQLYLIRKYLHRVPADKPRLSDITVGGYLALCGYFLIVIGYYVTRELHIDKLVPRVEYFRIVSIPYLVVVLVISVVRIHKWFARRGGYFERRRR